MSRRVVAAAAGFAVLAASIALALLGRAVLATPAAVDRAAPEWPRRTLVSVRRRNLADRVAASLLAADREDAFAQIVGIYRAAIALPAAEGDPKGPVEISRLIPRVRSSEERAQALVMDGALLAYSAGAGFGAVLPARLQAPTAVVLEQARADFRAAIRSDPGNEAAKYDLEFLLRQRDVQSPQPPQAKKRKKTATKQDSRRRTKRANGQEQHAGIYANGSGY